MSELLLNFFSDIVYRLRRVTTAIATSDIDVQCAIIIICYSKKVVSIVFYAWIKHVQTIGLSANNVQNIEIIVSVNQSPLDTCACTNI